MGKQRFTRTVALLPACSAGMQGVAAKGQTDKIFIRAVRRRTVCNKPCLRLSRWRKTCCRQRREGQNSRRVVGFLLHSRTDIFTRNRLSVVRKRRCFGNTCRYAIGRMLTQRIDFSFANKLHYRHAEPHSKRKKLFRNANRFRTIRTDRRCAYRHCIHD